MWFNNLPHTSTISTFPSVLNISTTLSLILYIFCLITVHIFTTQHLSLFLGCPQGYLYTSSLFGTLAHNLFFFFLFFIYDLRTSYRRYSVIPIFICAIDISPSKDVYRTSQVSQNTSALYKCCYLLAESWQSPSCTVHKYKYSTLTPRTLSLKRCKEK